MITSTRMHFVRARILTLGAGLSIALLIGAFVSRANRTGYFGTIRFGKSATSVTRSLGFGVNSGALVVAWTGEEVASAAGIHYGFGVRKSRASDWELQVPFWATAILLCVIPLWFASVHYQQTRRKLPGQCPNCGYDIRATPARCPECGVEQKDMKQTLGENQSRS